MDVGGVLKSVVGEGVGKGAEEGVYGCMGSYRECCGQTCKKFPERHFNGTQIPPKNVG